MTATNHSARADAIEQVVARFIAGETLSESDRSWIVFALGMHYRSEIDAARRAAPAKERSDG